LKTLYLHHLKEDEQKFPLLRKDFNGFVGHIVVVDHRALVVEGIVDQMGPVEWAVGFRIVEVDQQRIVAVVQNHRTVVVVVDQELVLLGRSRIVVVVRIVVDWTMVVVVGTRVVVAADHMFVVRMAVVVDWTMVVVVVRMVVAVVHRAVVVAVDHRALVVVAVDPLEQVWVHA